ncbi:Histidyl-tRNA synthetase [Clostridiaceae bacterium JG1575]|nr:Histidyl-tRNA synthetase [Clostridiaceae bacterium JG1575]
MKTTPVKGTNDFSPRESEIRDYLQQTILEVYRRYGFERIVTPILEDAENLDKSEGGDNLNLVFKILKRGEKLQEALGAAQEKELSDLGLRYDLTLPLCRYVANNRGKLIQPFKVIQMGTVYRAERPQKGRLREFMQCDIDIIGTSSFAAEVELLYVIAQTLLAIQIHGFTIRLNDRRVLKALLLDMGFAEDTLDSVCISFDKLDKIGAGAVAQELTDKGFPSSAIEAFSAFLAKGSFDLGSLMARLPGNEAAQNLEKILAVSQSLAKAQAKGDPHRAYEVVFDPSLVRGQGYYTGTVFEVVSDQFSGSIAGGGRYDNLIGKFIREDVPAVGISIGFERIFSILMAQEFQIPGEKPKTALLYDSKDLEAAFLEAERLREHYAVTLLETPKKLGPFLNRLKEKGFEGFLSLGEERVRPLN